MASDVAKSKRALFPHLRFAIHVRNPTQCRRGGGRVGDAITAAGRCEGVQKVLAEEASDEVGGVEENRKANEGHLGFDTEWPTDGVLSRFCNGRRVLSPIRPAVAVSKMGKVV